MTTGKSGYATFSASNSYGHKMSLKLGWQERYDLETAKSVLKITSLTGRNNYGGFWYPTGTLKVNGETLVTMTGTGDATHRFEFDYGGETWSALKSWHGGSIPPWETSEIAHNADGSKDVVIELTLSMWKDSAAGGTVKLSGSQTVSLTTIPRASEPTVSPESVELGRSVRIYTNWKASDFTHTLRYSMGEDSGTIASGVGESADWTVPMELAKQIPAAVTGEVTIFCDTYSGSTLVGTKSTALEVTVPENSETKPSFSMTLSPVGAIPGAFAGLYIKGKTRVKASFAAESAYSSIKGYALTVSGVKSTGNPATTGLLTVSGDIRVTGTVTDARGFTASVSRTITALPYDTPRVIPVNGQNAVVCERCLTDGTPDSGGLNLLIRAGRKYSQVAAEGIQKNFCTLRWRHRAAAGSWSEWATLISPEDVLTDETSLVAVGAVPSAATTYYVQIGVVDTMGSSPAAMDFIIPTDEVAFHLRAGGRGAGFGKYGEVDGGLDMGFFIEMNGNKVGGLPEPTSNNDAVPKAYVDNGFSKSGHDHDEDYAPKPSEGEYLNSVVTYYGTAMSADDLLVPTALIPVSSTVNSGLDNIVGGSFAYVITLFYTSVSTTSRRVQIGLSYNTVPAKMAVRVYGSNGWTAWKHPGFDENETYHALFRNIGGVEQYLNPVMALGTEYCTLERYKGKPVYTKLVNLGTLPDSTTKTVAHGLSGVTVVRYQAFADNGSYVQEFPFHNTAGTIVGKMYYSKDGIKIITYNDLSAYTGVIQLWYTK